MTKQMDHAEYPKTLKAKSMASLLYMRKDAMGAAQAARTMNSPNEGYYLDEVSYIGSEIMWRKGGL